MSKAIAEIVNVVPFSNAAQQLRQRTMACGNVHTPLRPQMEHGTPSGWRLSIWGMSTPTSF